LICSGVGAGTGEVAASVPVACSRGVSVAVGGGTGGVVGGGATG
jgi:hypothetical protein